MTDNRDLSPPRMLMEAQMRAEWEQVHAATLTRYRRALEGIAACATDCKSCQLLREVAQEALESEAIRGEG